MNQQHDKVPKSDKAARLAPPIIKSLIIGGILWAVSTGAHKEGQNDQLKADQANIAAARIQGKQEITDKLLSHTKPLQRFQWLESRSAEGVKELRNNQLFENAAKVQASVLAISSELDVSGQEVFERLVPEDAQEAYKQRNMNFIFVKDNPSNPNCLNPFSTEFPGRNGTVEVGFLPLDASPDNSHPDIDPRDSGTFQVPRSQVSRDMLPPAS